MYSPVGPNATDQTDDGPSNVPNSFPSQVQILVVESCDAEANTDSVGLAASAQTSLMWALMTFLQFPV